MKKMHLALITCLIFTSAVGFSQTKGYSSSFGYRGSFVSSASNPDVVSCEIYGLLGYNFNKRLTLRVPLDAAVHLFNDDDKRDYQVASVAGLGVGYNAIADGYNILEIAASAGNTLGGSDWQYMCFDGGVKWAVGSNMRRVFVGAGVKYYKSERAGRDSFCNGYVTVGFRFN